MKNDGFREKNTIFAKISANNERRLLNYSYLCSVNILKLNTSWK